MLQHGGQRNREDIQLTAAPENKGGAESVLPNSHFHLSSLTPFLSVWLISGNVQSTVQPSEGANSRFHGLLITKRQNKNFLKVLKKITLL